MGVSEKTIYRWIKQKKLPAFRINEQYRFNRAEILEWATSHRVNVSAELLRDPDEGKVPAVGLAEALRAGGIHYRVGGADTESVLRSVVDVMPLPEEVDKSFLLQVLIARESLGSTAVGDGIAIPHARNPIVLHVPRPTIALCFLEHPIDYGALDGKPVHTVFAIVSPTVSTHLNLLSKLAYALRQPDFAAVIGRQGTREDILAGASEMDAVIPRPGVDAAAGGAARP